MPEPPAFGEIRDGWYQCGNEWYLTRDALQKQFHIAGRKLAKITATTHRGGVNEGKLRVVIRNNPNNGKSFIVYSLDDMKRLKIAPLNL